MESGRHATIQFVAMKCVKRKKTSINELFAAHYSVGASADSGYEYLLKQFLLTGDKRALSQCMSKPHSPSLIYLIISVA